MDKTTTFPHTAVNPFADYLAFVPSRTTRETLNFKERYTDVSKYVSYPHLIEDKLMLPTYRTTNNLIKIAWKSDEWKSDDSITQTKKQKAARKKLQDVFPLIIHLNNSGRGVRDWEYRLIFGNRYYDRVKHLLETPFSDSEGNIHRLMTNGIPTLKGTKYRREVRTSPAIRLYKSSCEARYWDILHNEIAANQFKNQNLLTRPDDEAVISHLESLIGSSHKGMPVLSKKLLEGTKLPKKAHYIEDYLKTYQTLFSHELNIPRFSNDRDRLYSDYIQTPSKIRELFTYNGNKLTWIDYSSLHPILIIVKFLKEVELHKIEITDDEINTLKTLIGTHESRSKYDISHSLKDELAKLTRIDSNEIKVANLKYINMKERDMIKHYLFPLYESIAPVFNQWLRMSKESFKVDGYIRGGHKGVSRYLHHQEAIIMEKAIKRLMDNGIFALLAHDGIDVEFERGSEALAIIIEVFKEFDLPLNFTID